MDGTVLVADDDRSIRTVLSQALTRAGCRVHATSSLTTLMRWIGEGLGDAVVTDVMMPDGNGLDMLPKIAQDRPGLPVIVISAQNTVMTAIRAAEAEAWDYLPKPFDLPDLMARVARALDGPRAPRAAPPAPRDADRGDLPLIGQSAPMQALFSTMARLMHADLPLWIAGEQGTGKSLIARTMHEMSQRAPQPFVIVPPGDLAQKGAAGLILARAGAGTILLDGMNDMDAAAQVQALQLVDAAEALGTGLRPRLMAAAQPGHDLRSDLYHRLSGAVLDVPALRARGEDVALLATHFLYRAEAAGAPARRLAPEALDLMRAHDWPGNLRELDHAAQRLALGGRAPLVAASEVAGILRAAPASAPPAAGTLSEAVAQHVQRYFDLHDADLPPAGLYHRLLPEFEAPLLRIALDAVGGNQARCADLLGINRNTLRKKMTTLDIEVTRRGKMM